MTISWKSVGMRVERAAALAVAVSVSWWAAVPANGAAASSHPDPQLTPSAPPPPMAPAPPPPPPVPAPAVVPSAPQDSPTTAPAVDRAILKKSIKAVSDEFADEGRRWTAERRAEANARFQAARDQWRADQKRRNDTFADDDNDGISNREEDYDKRIGGNMGPPVPKFKDFPYQTWEDKMKDEVAAERRESPTSGKKGGTALISAAHPLAVEEMEDFIAKRRDRIADARIVELVGRIEKRYRADQAAADAQAAEAGGASTAAPSAGKTP